jgi:hypothetical protein
MSPTVSPSPVAVEASIWIRKPRRTRVAAATAVAFSLALAGIFFIPLFEGKLDSQTPAAAYLILALFFFGTAALGLALARRLARAGLWMGPTGIMVRNPLRTTHIALAQAEAFVPGVVGDRNGTPCPVLKSKPDGAVGVWALGREGVVFRYRRYLQGLQPLCDQLNDLLGALQSSAPANAGDLPGVDPIPDADKTAAT